ncbi:hypothetical protein [Alteromonas lipolytica]|uniref:Sulfotransferase domain-containing protein n=1 Tax=Alteromonas lipolytica TaxID=1856405 RepID=A0A1E8FET8_9ALTE|nr:hypothetical protein [Alteromonas lipolytica]OFI34442.1 hypothetical protein BFC17_17550 [Alteromonas lipolytica]GGF84558.1 hypothetical protein GCM10011338_41140 [Alteromonas lipolytica]
MNLYLHIGNHKTGSTAIQSILESNLEVLREADCLYPETGRVKGAHHGIVRHLKKETESHFSDFIGHKADEDGFNSLVNNLKEECDGYNNIIISSEEFFNYNSLDIERVKKFLSLFNNTTVITYLRNQLAHIESSYKFSISWMHDKECRSFNEYYKYQTKSSYHRYLPTIEFWELLVDKVECVCFEENTSFLVGPICKKLGIANPKEALNLNSVSRNKSPSVLEVVILQKLKAANTASEEISNIMKKVRSLIFRDLDAPLMNATFFTFDQYIYSRDLYKESNEIIQKMYGINLNRHVPDPKKLRFYDRIKEGKVNDIEELILYLMELK